MQIREREILIDREVFTNLISTSLRKGNAITMNTKGSSMHPFLKEGERIKVIFNKNLEVGDLVLFKSSNSLGCHRIVKKNKNGLYLKGDALSGVSNVTKENILGKVIEIEKGCSGSLTPNSLSSTQKFFIKRYFFFHSFFNKALSYNWFRFFFHKPLVFCSKKINGFLIKYVLN